MLLLTRALLGSKEGPHVALDVIVGPGDEVFKPRFISFYDVLHLTARTAGGRPGMALLLITVSFAQLGTVPSTKSPLSAPRRASTSRKAEPKGFQALVPATVVFVYQVLTEGAAFACKSGALWMRPPDVQHGSFYEIH